MSWLEKQDLRRGFYGVRMRASYETSGSDALGAFWQAAAADLRLAHVAFDLWTAGAVGRAASFDDLGKIVHEFVWVDVTHDAVVIAGEALVLVSLHTSGRVQVSAAAKSVETAREAVARVRRVIPTQEPSGLFSVSVKFWSASGPVPSSYDEVITMASWEDVAANYAKKTRELLEPLMSRAMADAEGKLMLWLGPPGTGKTYALRALAWEQRERVRIHYVLDPETFLERTDYIRRVFTEDREEESGDAPHARLIVLEDAGELVGADARQQAGAGLARVLNMTDGLPGQASCARILITTNEDVGRLHPAVTRAGRCQSLVRFQPFEEPEATVWLKEHGVVAAAPRAASLAELYALARGECVAEAPGVGFGARR